MALFFTILFGFVLGCVATFVSCRRVVRSNYIKRIDFDAAIAPYLSGCASMGGVPVDNSGTD